MITYIFKKPDNIYAGSVVPPHSVEVELENLVNSELGGTKTDYIVIESEERGSGVCSLIDGEIKFSPVPVDRVKASRNKKLLALGLTQEEIDA